MLDRTCANFEVQFEMDGEIIEEVKSFHQLDNGFTMYWSIQNETRSEGR